MGFGAGLGKSSSNSSSSSTGTDNSSTNSNFTQAPTNPDWVSNLAQSLGGNVSTLSSAPASSFVAGPNALQTQAGANAANLTGTPWDYNAALDVTGGVANAKTPQIADNINSFMSPYIGSVLQATQADEDHQAGLTRAQDDLNLAGSGAFGGSGAALTKAATEGELARSRATSDSNILNQGFTQAGQLATSQAQLDQNQEAQRLAAGGQLGNLASQFNNDQRATVAAQDAAGAPLQSISQAQAQAPIDFQSALTQLFSGLPLSLFQGQTGAEDQTGTETQTGTTKGKSTTLTASGGYK